MRTKHSKNVQPTLPNNVSPFDRPLTDKIIFQYRLLFAHSSLRLLERATATLANIALYAPAIPYLLRQTVIVMDDSGAAGATVEELVRLREEEEILLLEEIRLRECQVFSKKKNILFLWCSLSTNENIFIYIYMFKYLTCI